VFWSKESSEAPEMTKRWGLPDNLVYPGKGGTMDSTNCIIGGAALGCDLV
jgi:hypothetical protein